MRKGDGRRERRGVSRGDATWLDGTRRGAALLTFPEPLSPVIQSTQPRWLSCFSLASRVTGDSCHLMLLLLPTSYVQSRSRLLTDEKGLPSPAPLDAGGGAPSRSGTLGASRATPPSVLRFQGSAQLNKSRALGTRVPCCLRAQSLATNIYSDSFFRVRSRSLARSSLSVSAPRPFLEPFRNREVLALLGESKSDEK